MKKFLTFIIALILTSVSLAAQESGAVTMPAADSVLYTSVFYFEKNQGEWIEKYEYVKVSKLLKWAKANSSAHIEIKGWADPSGTKEFNARLSFKRAKAIRNYLVQKGIDPSRITFEGKGVDFESEVIKARRAAVVAYVSVPTNQIADNSCNDQMVEQAPEQDARAAEPIEAFDTQMQVEPETQAEEPVTADSKSCFEWSYFSPRTNLLYWLGGVMNIGFEYKNPDSNFGFLVNGGYSVFGDTTWNHNLGGWFVAPEIRYYLPASEQWFVGAQFLAGGYNHKFTETGRQGTVIGGGVMGGYKLTLNDTFDMDFTLGLGYGHLEYDTYYHDQATETNPYIVKGAEKNSIMPIQAGVNLIWKIK